MPYSNFAKAQTCSDCCAKAGDPLQSADPPWCCFHKPINRFSAAKPWEEAGGWWQVARAPGHTAVLCYKVQQQSVIADTEGYSKHIYYNSQVASQHWSAM